ncbi:MAG: hypothetical protein NZM25_01110 [Leptospiraceae bacterium]|nr:hypothetical protein [Leptospiraceae bacterium]MDW8306323.1 hypothetical protein [Leptospiraceae bacterium]
MVTGEAKVDKVVDFLKEKNIAIFQVNALTRNGREELMAIFNRVFIEFQLNVEYLFNIYSAIVEVIFNAIKANVKYIFYQEEIKKRIKNHVRGENLSDIMHIILRTEALRDYLVRFVVSEKLKQQTMHMLKLEEIARTRKDSLTSEEYKMLEEFHDKLKEEDMNIFFTIGIAPHQVAFAVVNDSPIMRQDMQRIERSRRIHYELYLEGRSNHYFSMENIDTTESAGLGIALADEVYYELGLDPRQYFTIVTEQGRTRALLRFPRKRISL